MCKCVLSEPCKRPRPLPELLCPVESLFEGIPTDEQISDAAAEKWDDCAHYSKCLSYAACMDWPQFSCHFCDQFEEDQNPVLIPVNVLNRMFIEQNPC